MQIKCTNKWDLGSVRYLLKESSLTWWQNHNPLTICYCSSLMSTWPCWVGGLVMGPGTRLAQLAPSFLITPQIGSWPSKQWSVSLWGEEEMEYSSTSLSGTTYPKKMSHDLDTQKRILHRYSPLSSTFIYKMSSIVSIGCWQVDVIPIFLQLLQDQDRGGTGIGEKGKKRRQLWFCLYMCC